MLPIYYCILENYKGRKRDFLGNTHLYLMPVSDEKYLYLGLLGEVIDKNDCYACRLIAEIEASLVDAVLAGEVDELGKRFKVIETLNCEPSHSEVDGYDIKLLEQGKYLQSDLILSLYAEHKNKAKPMFIIAGQIAFLSEPVI